MVKSLNTGHEPPSKGHDLICEIHLLACLHWFTQSSAKPEQLIDYFSPTSYLAYLPLPHTPRHFLTYRTYKFCLPTEGASLTKSELAGGLFWAYRVQFAGLFSLSGSRARSPPLSPHTPRYHATSLLSPHHHHNIIITPPRVGPGRAWN